MTVTGISSTSMLPSSNQNVVSKREQIQNDFQKLGKDLQSGDLSAAQSDYKSLQGLVPKLSTPLTPENNDPRVQGFNQLEKDMQSGDLSAAQQDYSKLQNILQSNAQHFHHNRHVDTGVQTTDPQPQATSTGISVQA